MHNRPYIPDGHNRLTRQLTLERQVEVLCLRIYCIRINPTREGIQRQVPIRRCKRRVARRPGEREVVRHSCARLDVLTRVGEARIRRTTRGVSGRWSPQELECLLFSPATLGNPPHT